MSSNAEQSLTAEIFMSKTWYFNCLRIINVARIRIFKA